MTRTRVLLVGLLVAVLLPASGYAQGRRRPRSELPGLDFSPNGVWRARAREVRRYRAALLSQRAFSTLNAPFAAGAPVTLPRTPQASPPQVVSGTLNVPVIMLRFKDSPVSPYLPADYNHVLFDSPTPPFGRPYTYRTYYQELSNGLLDIQGLTYGPTTLTNNEVAYTGTPPCSGSPFPGGTNCNGLFTNSQIPDPFTRMQNGLREALQNVVGTIDFSQYDADGDGYVDLVAFIQPTQDGACGGPMNNHPWSHRSYLSLPFVTNTPDPNYPGQMIKVRDYILESGLGGLTACDVTQIMPIGTVAHETGHGFGLPDLYSTDGTSEGIGEYGLMGSGNYTTGLSPSRMDAWSLNELGWVALAPITVSNVYSFGAAPTSDTAFVVQPTGPNPRGEYFLLENRQAVQSDSAMIRIHCQVSGVPFPTSCGGGLLVYHVDAQQVTNGTAFGNNSVQNGPIHGLELIQADGLGNLDANPSSAASNRGDGGDPYPGITHNPRLSFGTKPASLKNSDGTFVGFGIDSLKQFAPPNDAMSFYLQFGNVTVVRASDTAAAVSLDGAPYSVFRDMLDSLSTHTLSFSDSQLSADGRTRYRWNHWSDVGAKSHLITGQPRGDTLIAFLDRDRLLQYAAANNKGHVTTVPPVTSGSFLAEGTAVTVSAVVDSTDVADPPGYVFGGWTGDSASCASSLDLMMPRSYNVVATFFPHILITSGAARRDGVMGAAYADTLRAQGSGGLSSWKIVAGALPSGVALDPASGALSGFPRATGNFQFDARITSCTESQTQSFTIAVTAPVLYAEPVVAQLLGVAATLTADELRYLDYLGNSNGRFDVGDFKDWVDATGAPPTPPAVAASASRAKGTKP